MATTGSPVSTLGLLQSGDFRAAFPFLFFRDHHHCGELRKRADEVSPQFFLQFCMRVWLLHNHMEKNFFKDLCQVTWFTDKARIDFPS